MLKKVIQLYVFVMSSLFAIPCLAQTSQSMGEAVGNLLQPLGILGQLIKATCIIAGVGFIVGSLARYKRFRQNPVDAPLSSCIMLLITGVALIVLALIPMPK